MKNFRPASNLPFISKILEKVVLTQLRNHLSSNNLLEICQSAYRKDHSTETAVLSVLNGLLGSADERLVSLVALLDLSTAFVSLDHTISLQQLEMTYGVRGTVLDWFASYLSERLCCVRLSPSYIWRSSGFRIRTSFVQSVLTAFVRYDFCS